MATTNGNGDLNNLQAIRTRVDLDVDPAFSHISLAVPESEDDADVRARYRPFLLESAEVEHDWVADLELGTVAKMVQQEIIDKKQDRLRILVLYGSLRSRSFSRLLAFEFARILWRLGCDVRVYDPAGLPQKDDVQHDHVKVQELRELSKWSDGHVWVSPEQHGQLSSIFKQQIDWIPLSTGSVRPTQGRTLAVAQVSGGSQSFNTVNTLRVLGRWMRMFVIPNQSSVPVAYTQFTTTTSSPGEGEAVGLGRDRMKPSSNRDRLVDCAEELVKYTVVMKPHFALFGDRFSEREERRLKAEQRMPGM